MNNMLRYPAAIIMLIILACPSPGLTDLDYSLGGSRLSRESYISGANGFHGESSVWLSAAPLGSSKKYAGIYINPEDPVPVDDLDTLSFWVEPVKGDGEIFLEILLDADGDGKYANLKESGDLRLTATVDDLDTGDWREIDAFDLNFRIGSSGPSRDLGSWLEEFDGMGLVKFRIKLYSGAEKTSARFDYIRVGSQVVSFEPLEKEAVKKGPKSATPGGKITYTITYGNNFNEPIDLVITEHYDPMMNFEGSTVPPDAGTNNVWTIRDLPPGEHGQIEVYVRTPKLTCEAEITGSVSGKGYSSVSRAMSTDVEGYQVTNSVTLSAISVEGFNMTASKTTAIGAREGLKISFEEHGPGFYSSDESLHYSPSRIAAQVELKALQTPVSIAIPGGDVGYSGSLYALREAGSSTLDVVHRETFSGGDSLFLVSSADLGKSKFEIDTKSSFTGLARYKTAWTGAGVENDFAGSFTVNVKEDLRKYTRTKSRYKGWLDCPVPCEGDGCEPTCPTDSCIWDAS